MSQRDRIRLSAEEIRSYLSEGHTMILVSNGRNGHPHPMPMFYALGPDLTVRFTTYARSQKVKNIERDPRVTLLVETGHAYEELKGVVIDGKATIRRDRDLAIETMLGARRLRGEPTPPAEMLSAEQKQAMVGKRVVIEVTPERFVSWDHSKI